jgi:endonuclease YncB( thermonuclease family)
VLQRLISRVLPAAAVLVVGVGLSQPDPAPSQAGPAGPPAMAAPDPQRSAEGVVLSVQDGDSVTLMLDGELRRVELLGADAPEWLERARSQRHYAVESRRFLTNLLHGERVLVFEPEPGAVDPLGRRRAYLFRLPDMFFVDLEIIRQGYGKVSTRAGEPYADLLRWYETRARELERGVWDQTDDDAGSEAEPAAPPARVVESPDAAPAAPAPVQLEPEPQSDEGWVWVTRSGSKYHREGCSHLTSSRNRVRRDSIMSTHEPCKACNPD